MDNQDQITIVLSSDQRNLILHYGSSFGDEDLLRLVTIALKKGDTYEIHLTVEQLEGVLDQLADIYDVEANEDFAAKLDSLGNYLFNLLPGYTLEEDEFEDEEQEDYDDEIEFSQYSHCTGDVFILTVALEHAPKIWRRIAIRGGQTLHDLHYTIFDAFDRDEDHLYSFYILPRALKSRIDHSILRSSFEYTHPYNHEMGDFLEKVPDNAATTTIESLNLSLGKKFLYLFDFGDEWWHVITVEKVKEKPDHGEYPRILEQNGPSPPQYAWPEDEE
ncbi:MAG: plasmid pRiA4b ORF-3 family protein [Sedimentisphaerales bacterium]|nr:plasmid pRiA4b ORF-3 family protein [Sedimentisphaerales bacterium]